MYVIPKTARRNLRLIPFLLLTRMVSREEAGSSIKIAGNFFSPISSVNGLCNRPMLKRLKSTASSLPLYSHSALWRYRPATSRFVACAKIYFAHLSIGLDLTIGLPVLPAWHRCRTPGLSLNPGASHRDRAMELHFKHNSFLLS